MKKAVAIALALVLCAGLATTAYAHGWHGRGNHGYHNNWNNARADGYGGYGGYNRGGGPCWSDWDGNYRPRQQQQDRRGEYRDDRQFQGRGYDGNADRDDRSMPR